MNCPSGSGWPLTSGATSPRNKSWVPGVADPNELIAHQEIGDINVAITVDVATGRAGDIAGIQRVTAGSDFHRIVEAVTVCIGQERVGAIQVGFVNVAECIVVIIRVRVSPCESASLFSCSGLAAAGQLSALFGTPSASPSSEVSARSAWTRPWPLSGSIPATPMSMAVDCRVLYSPSGDSDGSSCFSRAASPAACGVAAEVPKKSGSPSPS